MEIANEIYSDSIEQKGPKIAKGGTFAPADIDLLKKIITSAVRDNNGNLTIEEERQAVNLLHRLGRIS